MPEKYKTIPGCITYSLINAGSTVLFAQIGVELIRNFINPFVNPLEIYCMVLAGNVSTTAITVGLLHFIKTHSNSP